MQWQIPINNIYIKYYLFPQEWSHCKALLNPHSDARGNMGLTKRILQFDNTRVDPRIARRVRDILSDIPFDGNISILSYITPFIF